MDVKLLARKNIYNVNCVIHALIQTIVVGCRECRHECTTPPGKGEHSPHSVYYYNDLTFIISYENKFLVVK